MPASAAPFRPHGRRATSAFGRAGRARPETLPRRAPPRRGRGRRANRRGQTPRQLARSWSRPYPRSCGDVRTAPCLSDGGVRGSGPTDSEGNPMPKYLIEASYTQQGAEGVLSAGGRSRSEAVDAACKSVGGTMESFHFAFGDVDAYVICDLPSNQAATALALSVNVAGGASATTTVLLTPEEVDAASQQSAEYRAPGD